MQEFEYWVRENPGVVKPLFGWLLLSDTSTKSGSGREGEESIESSHTSTAEEVDATPKLLCSDVNGGEGQQSEMEAIMWLPSQRVKACLASRSSPPSALLSQPVVKHHRFQVSLMRACFRSAVSISRVLCGVYLLHPHLLMLA